MAEDMEIPQYLDQGREPQSLKPYLQDCRRYRDTELLRYLDIDLWSYRDMRIPRYRYQTKKYEMPKYRDKEIKIP